MLTLCFYLQNMLDPSKYKVSWIRYSDDIRWHEHHFADKCKNKLENHYEIIDAISKSDLIVYQNVIGNAYANSENLQKLKKNQSRILKLPSIVLDYKNYNHSIMELKRRESLQQVDITVSNIFEQNVNKNLMITHNHPKTFVFMELLKEISSRMNFTFYPNSTVECFLKDDNYMQLPDYTPPSNGKWVDCL